MRTAKERMTAVETKIDNMHEDIRDIKDSLKDSFASKWVEKGFISLLITIIGSVAVYAFAIQ